MTFGTWRWWCCQPHTTAAFTPKKCSWYPFSLGTESTRPQSHGTVGRNMSLKNPVTPPEIDPGTVPVVAQRLIHYATPGPNPLHYSFHNSRRNVTELSPSECHFYFKFGSSPSKISAWRPLILTRSSSTSLIKFLTSWPTSVSAKTVSFYMPSNCSYQPLVRSCGQCR